MKNVLLLIHDDAGQEARLQAALDLTRALDGHLTCLDVAMMPTAMAGDDCMGLAMLLEEEHAREDVNRAKTEQRLADEKIGWEWTDTTGPLAPCIEDAACMADVIVVNRKLDSFPVPDMRAVTAELIVKCDKPILAVPDDCSGIDTGGSALVAWDGSVEASAALQAAVPLLRLASCVRLFEVVDGSIETPAEEAAAYLFRHGVETTVTRVRCERALVAETILAEVQRRHAAYLVMGGFGHPRFIEALFGGVTRKLLSESPVPLFLAH